MMMFQIAFLLSNVVHILAQSKYATISWSPSRILNGRWESTHPNGTPLVLENQNQGYFESAKSNWEETIGSKDEFEDDTHQFHMHAVFLNLNKDDMALLEHLMDENEGLEDNLSLITAAGFTKNDNGDAERQSGEMYTYQLHLEALDHARGYPSTGATAVKRRLADDADDDSRPWIWVGNKKQKMSREDWDKEKKSMAEAKKRREDREKKAADRAARFKKPDEEHAAAKEKEDKAAAKEKEDKAAAKEKEDKAAAGPSMHELSPEE